MIRYRLICAQGHEFDAWFRDSATFAAQSRAGDVLCPHCGDSEVQKALMAPGLISASRRKGDETEKKQPGGDKAVAALPASAKERHRQELLLALARRHIERNFDYLGEEFPDEARRIHKGDAPARNIYGEASDRQVRDLAEEGIEVFAMPGKPPGAEN